MTTGQQFGSYTPERNGNGNGHHDGPHGGYESAAPRPGSVPDDARGPRGDTVNPYLNARREWNERYGSYVAQRDAWRRAAFVSWGVSLLAVAGLTWVAAQPRLQPYVVAVDRLGAPVPIAPAEQAIQGDRRIVRAELARWITNIRSVSPDAAAERTAVTAAYALLNRRSAAFETVNEFMRANNPFERARRETVSVEIVSVLPLTGETWRVEWREIVRARDGSVTSTQPWQAALTLTTSPPRDEQTVLRNPLGLYVTALSWSQRL